MHKNVTITLKEKIEIVVTPKKLMTTILLVDQLILFILIVGNLK